MATLDLRKEAQRELPHLGDYPEALRLAALRTWHGRMVNEHGSALVFEGLRQQLESFGAKADVVAACRSFADEERRHGALCGAVVEALGGQALAAEVPSQSVYPLHEDALSPREATLRNLISICCLSETVAVALIGAERLDMPPGELRDLLTEIYADEVGHARFGWAHLASLLGEDQALRQRLAVYLRVAFGHLEHHELEHLPLASCPPPQGNQLGLCSGAEARELFFDTVEKVIVPGLEAHGIAAASAWVERVAPA